MGLSKLVWQYIMLLTVVLAVVLLAHSQILSLRGYPPWGDMLLRSYIVKFILAAAIFVGLFLLRNRFKNQIGFLYMGGSLLKFLVFFLVFYPPYRADGVVSKLEFAAFFIPYLICLIFETAYTAKMLNALK